MMLILQFLSDRRSVFFKIIAPLLSTHRSCHTYRLIQGRKFSDAASVCGDDAALRRDFTDAFGFQQKHVALRSLPVERPIIKQDETQMVF